MRRGRKVSIALAAVVFAAGGFYAVNRLFPRVFHGGSIQVTAGIATSDRSRAAAQKVTPVLKAALAENGLGPGAPVFIRIFKSERELELWVLDAAAGKYALFRKYPIQKSSGTLGPKMKEGDRQAPEGFYSIRPEALNPLSRFNLSFDIGYPNDYDRSLGRTGNQIMVHGGASSVGCFAMGDDAIEEIYTLIEAALRAGQPSVPLHVYPFRMDAAGMAAHAEPQWAPFWANLEEGYAFFETNRVPPKVDAKEGRYVFSER
jgi:murein L,D-transpeptidase YafK